MYISTNYKLRNIAGNYLLVNTGSGNNGQWLVELNESAASIFKFALDHDLKYVLAELYNQGYFLDETKKRQVEETLDAFVTIGVLKTDD